MEKDQPTPPPWGQEGMSGKHEPSAKSSTVVCKNNKVERSRGQQLDRSISSGNSCPTGHPKPVLPYKRRIDFLKANNNNKGLLGPAPCWNGPDATSSLHPAQTPPLPPKKRQQPLPSPPKPRQQPLPPASPPNPRQTVPPALSTTTLALSPLKKSSNGGASMVQKSNQQDSSSGLITWSKPTTWWSRRRMTPLSDADNTTTLSQEGGVVAAPTKKSRVEWGFGLAKYEKQKMQGSSQNLPADGSSKDDTGDSSKGMAATTDCPAPEHEESSSRGNLPPDEALY